MDILVKIYWLRVVLGAFAGLICTGAVFLFQSFTPTVSILSVIGRLETLLNGVTIALLIYLISYYVLKAKFLHKVEKQSKIMTMGIFIYFFTWLVVWVLSLSIIIGPM